MPTTWINALSRFEASGTPCVLITIIDDQGSTPRNAGAKMLVSTDQQFDTIGGGHLEFKAIKLARELLDTQHSQPRLQRFSLGASLGQCCGGATTLLFEPIGTAQVEIGLFGAGHVGRALIPLLSSLPCRIRWIDSRAAEFPAAIPAGVTRVVSEFPEDEVATLPPHSYFIIMTHNHQLDQRLCEHILQRADFAYLGLIGSRTKRRKFEMRLRAKGFNDSQLARITCPIGLPQVRGKLAAEIAIAVAAEVIACYSTAKLGSNAQSARDIIKQLAV